MSTAYSGDGITFPDNTVQNTAPKVGMVNRVINGGMVVDQRNAGASVSLSGAGQYIVDRMKCRLDASSSSTGQQVADAPVGFNSSIKLTIGTGAAPSSSQLGWLSQSIEGFNTADLGWGTSSAKTATLSFWVKSSVTGTFSGVVRNGGTSAYAFGYTVSSANTWERKAVTIIGDTANTWGTDNGLGIGVFFDLGTGTTFQTAAGVWSSGNYFSASGSTALCATSGATFYVTGVQLEKGSTATDFEYVDYGRQLQQCQRYCFSLAGNSGNIVGLGFTGTTVSGTIGVAFPVEMRVLPTLVSSLININDSQALYTGTSVSLAYSGALKFNALFVAISGGVVGRGCQAYWAANNSKAIFSAEL